ncbi:hypothetical protein PROFUN_08406 [Planoprotostelium fungivorum]|uniref:Uncharacterized protein n=1 Tax=Planoprotostelium fungivorum TaxID=1890364 RepID=A0A2P6NJU1_9EUKA|nr:hypothetical protein PROFUN_08406 [Planoprotostelium fungivorum]
MMTTLAPLRRNTSKNSSSYFEVKTAASSSPAANSNPEPASPSKTTVTFSLPPQGRVHGHKEEILDLAVQKGFSGECRPLNLRECVPNKTLLVSGSEDGHMIEWKRIEITV